MIYPSIKELKQIFLSKYKLDDETKCWNWIGHIKNNYGELFYSGINYRAHRLSLYLYDDFDINSKLFVCHKCDNTKCVNPQHLFVGSNEENMKDMVSKNRQAKGFNLPQTKLSEQDFNNIRNMYQSKKYNQYELAKMFKTSQSIISRIIKGNYRFK